MPIVAGGMDPRGASIVVGPVRARLRAPQPRRLGLDEWPGLSSVPTESRRARRGERDDRRHGRDDDRTGDADAVECDLITILVDVH
jgi:hypothetical protein